MTEDQRELLTAARRSCGAADLLLDGGYPAFAASRAYYAMFYVAEAFLEGEGLSFSKHSAVIAAFGREFAKTGRVSADFHRYLIEAQQMRATGDYGPFEAVTVPHAQEQIARAKEFLAAAEQLFGPLADKSPEAP